MTIADSTIALYCVAMVSTYVLLLKNRRKNNHDFFQKAADVRHVAHEKNELSALMIKHSLCKQRVSHQQSYCFYNEGIQLKVRKDFTFIFNLVRPIA